MKFTIPGKPECWKRPRISKWGGFYDADYKHKKYIAQCALSCKDKIPFGNLLVDVTFYLPDKHRRDIDNMIKILFDALNGVLFSDDSQVVRIIASKIYGEKNNPRTEVEIVPF